MPSILVRGLKPQVVQRLKERARRNGRSLQGEARLLLERSAGSENIHAILDRWQRRFARRRFVPTVNLIRRDRNR
jgi:plasmid stability protein